MKRFRVAEIYGGVKITEIVTLITRASFLSHENPLIFLNEEIATRRAFIFL